MATELAKAYVQIMPSAKGIKGKITNELNGESLTAGKSAGLKIAGAIKGAIAAAGIGTALVKTIQEGAKLEQSIGGIETLFKDSADTMIKYSKQAYKTAGLSANDYMETVTSFSASLISSLGGDTEKAVKYADMAITDMSDNANKMGTNMQDIQNAYQGFAKQNYTMLDNLKLGYGGTKSEMERLLQDAEKITGVHYDISNLSDVYEAIHVIQENLDITGTTAKEAEETLSGSFNSMKAAAEDFMGALTMGYDMQPYVEELVSSAFTFLKNLVPAVGRIAFGLVQTLASGIIDGLPKLAEGLETLASKISTFATEKLPLLIPKGVEAVHNFAQGLVDNTPAVLLAIGKVLLALGQAILQAIPGIFEMAVELVGTIGEGILNGIGYVLSAIGTLLGALLGALLGKIGSFFSTGVKLVGSIGRGIASSIGNVVSSAGRVVKGIINSFTSINWGSIGTNIIKGIANGITSGISWVVNAAKNAAKSAFNAAKNFLKIKSPSRKFMYIGDMTMQGFAKGILDNNSSVESAMDKTVASISNGVEKDISINALAQTRMQGNLLNDSSSSSQIVNQTININQPVKTPAETAKAIRRQTMIYGLAGDF